MILNLPKTYFTRFMLAVVAVPLGDTSVWKELQFSSLPANKVSYEKSSLKVEVNHSASPLIHRFSEIRNIKQIDVELEIIGQMNSEKIKKWTDFEEDSYFRMGLVKQGNDRPSRLKMLFAPEWVKTLFSMAPKGTGLDKIYFYNVTAQKNLVGKMRSHPKSKYMHEENVIAFSPEEKNTNFKIELPQPMSLAGFWISIDGDDSKSTFTVLIKKLNYTETDK